MIQHARRLLLSLGLAIVMACGLATQPALAEVPYLSLIQKNSSKFAAIVVDAKTGEVLYAKRADATRYPASITKVMTLYLTFEALTAGRLSLDDEVVFSPHAAAQQPTKLGVRAGDSITVLQAIKALTTLSANDAAVALAEKIAGTESRFTTLMTLRAQELGMQNTHFSNANGLPDSRNVSTARDLAILSRAVMRDYPQYYGFFGLVSFNFRGRTIRNHNHLLSEVPGVDGLKTGFTNASGYNIAISGVRDNRRLIVVVLGGPTRITRDRVAESLLLTGFDVIHRRELGEDIQVAQNFFEPPALAQATEPSMQQGDSEDRASIRLTSAPPPSRASKIQIVDGREVAQFRDGDRAKITGKWTVQVGTFKSHADARKQLSISGRRYAKIFSDARAIAERDSGKYRARFAGMTERDAKAACRTLKSDRQPCLVIGPNS